MKNLNFSFVLLIVSLISFSCSKKGKQVDTSLSITSFIGGSTFSGGVMIWGQGPDGNTLALSLQNENEEKELLLASGDWVFYAVGWTGASQIEGPMSCALTSMDLSPENSNVNLNMVSSNCLNNDFAPSSFMIGDQFSTIKLIVCNDITGKTAGDNCDSTEKGAAKSFRFILNELDENNNERDGLSSVCIDESGGSVTQTTFQIPVGNANNFLFKTSIEAYENLGCNGNVYRFSLNNGILNSSQETLAFSNSSITEVFLNSPVSAPNLGSYLVSPAVYNDNVAIVNNTVSNTGGAGVTFTISPSLPAGLTMSASTGEISGMPSGETTLTTYTITVTGPSGLTSSTNLDITVLEETPTISSYSETVASYIKDSTIAVNIPTTTGGTVSSFSISPALPTGLSFNTSTGQISGVPTVASASNSYTVTATNSGGSNSLAITIEVINPANLVFTSPATHDFGPVTTGASSTPYIVNLTNDGDVPATTLSPSTLSAPFSYLGGAYPGTGGNCGVSIGPGSVCSIVISYQPVSAASDSMTFTMNYNDGNTGQAINKDFDGEGVTPASLTISGADPFDYGSVTVGGFVTQIFTVTNSGGSAATSINEVSLSGVFSYDGGSFPGAGGTCTATLAAGSSCTIVINYQPSTSVVDSQSIDISYDNGASVTNVVNGVTGTGVNPALLSFADGAVYNFGIAEIYENIPFFFQGLWDANTNSPSLVNGTGTASDYYRVNTAGSHSFGAGPSLDFAINDLVVYSSENTWVKRSAPKVHLFTVTNDGDSAATLINDEDLATPFRYTGSGALFPGDGGTCGTSLAPAASCLIEVEVTPTGLSLYNRNLELAYDDGVTTQNVAINMEVGGGVIISAASSTDSKCVVFNNGLVKCWGGNTYGELGRSDTAVIGDNSGEMGVLLNAVSLQGTFLVKKIAAGNNHFCALSRDGEVKCWGRNNFGQLGLGDTENRGDQPSEMGGNLPSVNLGTGLVAKSLVASGDSTCVILNNNKIKCWGYNQYGQLGHGHTNNKGSSPAHMGDNLPFSEVHSSAAVKSITMGESHVCSILADDSVKCWGRGTYGATSLGSTGNLGDVGSQMGDNLPFIDMGGGELTKSVSAGLNHTCAILASDTVKCWGKNTQGQLGYGDSTQKGDTAGTQVNNLPTVFLSPGTPKQIITTNDNQTCALMNTGVVNCWGSGTAGSLGTGNVSNIGDGASEMGTNLLAIDFGAGRSAKRLFPKTTCALLDNNEFKCWGRNNSGQLGLGDIIDRGDNAGEMGDNLPAIQLR